jgi:hypothetical protein
VSKLAKSLQTSKHRCKAHFACDRGEHGRHVSRLPNAFMRRALLAVPAMHHAHTHPTMVPDSQHLRSAAASRRLSNQTPR